MLGRCHLERQGSSNLLRAGACPIHPAASMAGVPPRLPMAAGLCAAACWQAAQGRVLYITVTRTGGRAPSRAAAVAPNPLCGSLRDSGKAMAAYHQGYQSVRVVTGRWHHRLACSSCGQ